MTSSSTVALGEPMAVVLAHRSARVLRPPGWAAFIGPPHFPHTYTPEPMYLRTNGALDPRRVRQVGHQTAVGVLVDQRRPVALAGHLAAVHLQTCVARIDQQPAHPRRFHVPVTTSLCRAGLGGARQGGFQPWGVPLLPQRECSCPPTRRRQRCGMRWLRAPKVRRSWCSRTCGWRSATFRRRPSARWRVSGVRPCARLLAGHRAEDARHHPPRDWWTGLSPRRGRCVSGRGPRRRSR